MLKMRLMTKVHALLLAGTMLLAACGASEPELTPTVTFSADEIRTQAVATFSIDLTQTALAAPTDTPMPTITPIPTFPTLATAVGGTPFGAPTTIGAGGSGTTSCNALTFVSDVTIPDNTQMTPGQNFTKTWKVLNSGTCAWDAGFKFALTGGDAMGSTPFTLPSAVAAGAQYDISVPMTAPSGSGTFRGNWRMSTASGQFFGDEIYVVIVVGGGAVPTNTSGPPAANTATPTP